MQALIAETLPWVVAFYLLDGLINIRRGQIVLSSARGVRFRLLRPGLHYLGWSPMAEAIATMDLPWLISDAALLVFDPRRRVDLATICEDDVSAIPWSDVVPEAVGKKVRSRGRTLTTTTHPAIAAQLAAELAALVAARNNVTMPKPAPPFDYWPLTETRHRQRWWRRGLKAIAVLLFLWTLGCGMLAYYGSEHPLLPVNGFGLLVALVCLELALVVGYVRAAGGSWTDAVSQASWLVMWPVATLHPLLHVSLRKEASRPALEVAAAVLATDEFRELAATEFGRAEVSLTSATGPLAEGLARRARNVAALAKRAGIEERELQRAPGRHAGEMVWCPTCRSRFIAGTAQCADCGVLLRPF